MAGLDPQNGFNDGVILSQIVDRQSRRFLMGERYTPGLSFLEVRNHGPAPRFVSPLLPSPALYGVALPGPSFSSQASLAILSSSGVLVAHSLNSRMISASLSCVIPTNRTFPTT